MSFLADVSTFTSRQRTSLIAEVSQLNVFCTQVGCVVNLSSFQETLRLLKEILFLWQMLQLSCVLAKQYKHFETCLLCPKVYPKKRSKGIVHSELRFRPLSTHHYVNEASDDIF